ncbi:MAG: DUF4350 domain-containing protein [Planctomycetota bacterium]
MNTTSIYTGFWCSAFAACLALGVYGPAAPWWAALWAVFAALAFAVTGSARGSTDTRRVPLVTALLGLALCAFDSTFLAGALLGLGGIARLAGRPRPAIGLETVGVLLCVAAGLDLLWQRFEMLHVLESWALWPLYGVLRAAGVAAALGDGQLAFNAGWGSEVVVADHVKLASFVFVLLVAWHLVWFASRVGGAAALRRTLRFAAVLGAFGVLRFVAVVLLTAEAAPFMTWIVEGRYILGSMAPGLLLTIVTARRSGLAPAADAAETATQPPTLRPHLLGVAGVLLGTVALHYHDRGSPAAGRVVFDEVHSEWERAEHPFDTEEWGRKSTYNYWCLADVLARYHGATRNLDQALDDEFLEGVQVLVLKTPTKPYQPNEVAAIHRFVARGGGLWLIGDHTNLFGMGVFLNQVAEPMGVRFAFDSTLDARSGMTTDLPPQRVRHPAAAEVDELEFQTSCSLIPTRPDYEPIFVGRWLTSELADYGNPNFFSNITTDQDDRVGTFAQALALPFGRGRVVAFSDSTILSNFSVFDRGVFDMVLDTMHYLQHRERLPSRWRSSALLVALLAVGGWLGRLRPGQGPAPWTVAAVSLAAALLGTACERHVIAGAPPAPVAEAAPFAEIAFVEQPSRFVRRQFVAEAMNMAPEEKRECISALFAWCARLRGVRPSWQENVVEAVASNPAAVMLFEPGRMPTPDEMRALVRYTAAGGKVLVVDDVRSHRSSGASSWLGAFGLGLEVEWRDVRIARAAWPSRLDDVASLPTLAGVAALSNALDLRHPTAGAEVGLSRRAHALRVTGGTPLFVDQDGGVLGAVTRVGDGQVFAFAAGSAWTDEVLGTRADVSPASGEIAASRTAIEMLKTVLHYRDQLR